MNKNMNKILDKLMASTSNKKFYNEDVSKELLNQYLLESKGEYKYFIDFYNDKSSPSYWTIKQYYEDLLINKLIKLHIYNEAVLIYKIFRNIFGIVLVPIYMLKLILALINRVKNLLLRILKLILK